MSQPSHGPSLSQSHRWCRSVCRASNSSFYPAFRLLTQQRRQAMEALYAFARITDDLGDNGQHDELNVQQLQNWKLDTTEHLRFSNAPATCRFREFSSLWPALSDACNRYSIPPQLLIDLIDGCVSDQHFVQPETWNETLKYCYQVASTIGIACTHIWQAASLADHDAALKCGYAFQLTNILRDISEDAQHGRIYLPVSEFKRHDVSAESWLAGRPDPGWMQIIDDCVQRAQGYYRRGAVIAPQLSSDGRRMFGLMWRSYHQLLQNVHRHRDLLWTGDKIRLSRFQKIKLASQALVRTAGRLQ